MGSNRIEVPFEPTEEFYKFLQDEIKLSAKKAFHIIYYLQERFEWDDEDGTHHYGLLPDKYERCHAQGCNSLYNTESEGCQAMRCDSHTCYEDIECDDCQKYKRLK
jgi:hypothetical protein